jgi:hypothetical protein
MASVERQAYHNVPAWQWRAILELVAGRLQLRCVKAHWCPGLGAAPATRAPAGQQDCHLSCAKPGDRAWEGVACGLLLLLLAR